MTNERLIELYKLVLEEIEERCLSGICKAISDVYCNNWEKITEKEFNELDLHFIEYTSYLEPIYDTYYYFPKGEKAPRIKLLLNIIADLETTT